jgi:hypothetical protein
MKCCEYGLWIPLGKIYFPKVKVVEEESLNVLKSLLSTIVDCLHPSKDEAFFSVNDHEKPCVYQP